MKLDDAISIGKECGLNTLEEAVNNILHWSDMCLFTIEEIDELVEEAKDIGIEFHNIPGCGLAMINGRCYICDKLSKLQETAKWKELVKDD
jgi:hypothetical protein